MFSWFRRLQPKSGERRRSIYRYVEIHIKKHGTSKASRNRQVLLERTRFQSTFSIHLKQIQATGFDLGFYMALNILESGLLKVNRASTPTQLYLALSH